jgi:hypothetical protein
MDEPLLGPKPANAEFQQIAASTQVIKVSRSLQKIPSKPLIRLRFQLTIIHAHLATFLDMLLPL